MQTSKNVQCKKCLNKFHQKQIYTIQQFQYKKQPKYEWTLKFFNQLQIDEWDSFCEECIMMYSKKLDNAWQNQKSQVL
jgi:hypothetical protein